jgi:hypothetical protein
VMIKEMRLLCDYLLNKLIVVKTYISNLVFFSEVLLLYLWFVSAPNYM